MYIQKNDYYFFKDQVIIALIITTTKYAFNNWIVLEIFNTFSFC